MFATGTLITFIQKRQIMKCRRAPRHFIKGCLVYCLHIGSRQQVYFNVCILEADSEPCLMFACWNCNVCILEADSEPCFNVCILEVCIGGWWMMDDDVCIDGWWVMDDDVCIDGWWMMDDDVCIDGRWVTDFCILEVCIDGWWNLNVCILEAESKSSSFTVLIWLLLSLSS